MLAFCRQFLTAPALALVIVALVGACSGDSQPTLEAGALDSTATLVVGDVTYELRVACYEADANLTAVGVGTDAESGKPIKGLVRGPDAAYVGLMFGDDEYIYEADANTPLTIARDGDRLAGEAVAFVRDIDLDTAAGSAIGSGSIVVDCVSKRAGVPDSPLSTR
jgi:hypothetical protein